MGYAKHSKQYRHINQQLPDLGANNKPPTYRADLWKPLWTLVFPKNEGGYGQGLGALKLLREWRMLREHYTEPSARNAIPYTAKQLEEVKERLDERGGSKRETEFHIVKRIKKKARIKKIMDQKANSVADLAAVLLHQEKEAQKLHDYRKDTLRPQEVQDMIRLADTAAEEVPKLQEQQVAMQAVTAKTGEQARLDGDTSKAQAAKTLKTIGRRLAAFRDAVKGVQEARLKLYYDKMKPPPVQETKQNTTSKDDKVKPTPAQGTMPDTVSAELPQVQESTQDTTSEELAQVEQIVEPWRAYAEDPTALAFREADWKELDPYLPSFEKFYVPAKLPKKGAALQEIKRRTTQLYSLNGVRVQWENIFDAEYAELWPDAVEHESMPKPEWNAAPRAFLSTQTEAKIAARIAEDLERKRAAAEKERMAIEAREAQEAALEARRAELEATKEERAAKKAARAARKAEREAKKAEEEEAERAGIEAA